MGLGSSDIWGVLRGLEGFWEALLVGLGSSLGQNVMISGGSGEVLRRGFGRPCWWVLGVVWEVLAGKMGSQVP